MNADKATAGVRIFYASSPSAVVCLVISLAYEPLRETQDLLILQSDFYAGTNIAEYQTVIEALASGYPWTRITYCDGVSSTREWARREQQRSRFARLRAEVDDARNINEFVTSLLADITLNANGKAASKVEEVWADGPAYIPRILYPKYRGAKKVLYPHAPEIIWGTDHSHFIIHNTATRAAAGVALKERMMGLWETLAPLALSARLSPVIYDKAYTFRGENYLAREVVDLSQQLDKESFSRVFACLPRDVQDYFTQISVPDEAGRRPSILFLSNSRSSQDIELEARALSYLLTATSAVRKDGPVIIKPHPRGSEEYLREISERLKMKFPEIRFRLMNSWGSVPIEVAAVHWDVTCCYGIITAATSIMKWIHNVPAYWAPEFALQLYERDPVWSGIVERFRMSNECFLVPV